MEKVLMAQSRLCSGQTLTDSAGRGNTPAWKAFVQHFIVVLNFPLFCVHKCREFVDFFHETLGTNFNLMMSLTCCFFFFALLLVFFFS